jgi:hypothetical protein
MSRSLPRVGTIVWDDRGQLNALTTVKGENGKLWVVYQRNGCHPGVMALEKWRSYEPDARTPLRAVEG